MRWKSMAKFTPEPIVIRTPLDEQGSLLDVTRIAGEDLVSYAERLFDAYANRASSTYQGLLNGINRELDLERRDLMTVNIRALGFGSLTDPSITFTNTTITNNTSYTDTIDGVNITATGSTLTDTNQSWTPGYLRGLKLKILSDVYEIIDNTETTVTVNANMSGLVGETYLIEVDWLDNELVGLGLKIGNRLFKVSENTAKTLRIESGEITTVDGTEYKLRAFNPKVEVTASKFNLYKEFVNDENFQLEASIDIRDDVKFHRQIVDEINKLRFFEAVNLAQPREDVFAFTLNRQSSENTVIKETVPAAKFFKLSHPNIKLNSVRFTEANIFLREVDEDQVSQALGNYNVDYDQGIVKVNSTPSGRQYVSYQWNDFPFTVTNSLAIINPFNEEDSQEFLFLQKEMIIYNNENDRFRNSVPKADMIEYMAELLKVKPDSWGE